MNFNYKVTKRPFFIELIYVMARAAVLLFVKSLTNKKYRIKTDHRFHFFVTLERTLRSWKKTWERKINCFFHVHVSSANLNFFVVDEEKLKMMRKARKEMEDLTAFHVKLHKIQAPSFSTCRLVSNYCDSSQKS